MVTMSSKLISTTLNSLNKWLPNSLLQIVKSLLFSKKHFVTNFLNSSATIPQEIRDLKSFVLLMGHSNFVSSMGGTERVIVEQVEHFLESNVDSLFVFPKTKAGFFRPSKYGLILNGFELSEVSCLQLFSFFKQVQPKVKELHLHHLLFWSLADVLKILKLYKTKKINIDIYTHDFYFNCPKVNFFCQAGSLNCRESYYKWTINLWRKTFCQILEYADRILAPSEYMSSQVTEKTKLPAFTQAPRGATIPAPKKPRLAFLGSASNIKGYETWLSLTRNSLVTRAYDLIHIGSAPPKQGSQNFPYSYKYSKSCIASELLKKLEVDQVLLWSQVPESYSFTLQEAKTAGKYVLTSSKSGNIAHTLSQNSELGRVFESEYQLFQYLLKIHPL
jgi:hypothetical protein